MGLWMMFKGFFANINMKAKNKVKGSQAIAFARSISKIFTPVPKRGNSFETPCNLFDVLVLYNISD